MPLSADDKEELKNAKRLLENPGFAAKAANLLGYPIEKALDRLPDRVKTKLGKAAKAALATAAEAALYTLQDTASKSQKKRWHKIGAALSGGVAGFFGIPALVVELPISTTIMLRSVAAIARSQGESISAPETKAACIEVFAMGGASESDDAAESGYYAVRIALAQQVAAVSEHLAEQTAVKESAPAVVQFITAIAERFSIQVSEKAAAQAVPVVGAIGGASINLAFIHHFQSMARGHFTIRRLERKYGKDTIEAEYRGLDD